MTYQKDTELITSYRQAGLTIRDLANLLQMAPGTVSGKLAGFSTPLDYSQRKKVLELCERAVKAQNAQTLL